MLVEKEVIRPGTYWYVDEKTGVPHKWVVTSETTKYLDDQGNKMLACGLSIPIPCEHDFQAHPMTPADRLKNNAGQVKEFRLKGDTLWSVCDIQDEEIARKIPKTIRWTSPWINSFVDGSGRSWNNVVAHLALTTRPRVTKQSPFPSIAAALSLATPINLKDVGNDGFVVSKAGRLIEKDKKLRPEFPMAFSMLVGGIKLGDDMPPKKKKHIEGDDDNPSPSGEGPAAKKRMGEEGGGSSGGGDKPPKKKDKEGAGEGGEGGGMDDGEGGEDYGDDNDMMSDFADKAGDIKMEELLCDLLGALGIQVEAAAGEAGFKRALYNAAMTKIYELTGKGQGGGMADTLNQPPTGQGNNTPPNPLIQQEQQPMYMSLTDIDKISDPTMKTIALSMYNENVKLRGQLDANTKTVTSLRDVKLKEENVKRSNRVALLGKMSPRVKADLDAMIAQPSMALSMGDGGAVVDPMAQTLAVLEKGLSDMPRLLTTPASEIALAAQPTDADILSEERANEISDSLAKMMGCPPEPKKAS